MKKKFVSLKGLKAIKKEQLKQIKGGAKKPLHVLYGVEDVEDIGTQE